MSSLGATRPKVKDNKDNMDKIYFTILYIYLQTSVFLHGLQLNLHTTLTVNTGDFMQKLGSIRQNNVIGDF